MERIARVVKINGSKAIVKVKRETSCGGHCGSCGGCEENELETVVLNSIGAERGDIVLISLSSGKVLFGAFLLYILPIITLIIGYFVYGIVGSLIGFALPYISLYKFNNSFHQSSIEKVIEKCYYKEMEQ